MASPVRVATSAVAAVAILGGLMGHFAGALPSLEQDAAEARIAVGHRAPRQDIVIVDIDTRTFAQIPRRWPFPRSMHAQAIDRIALARPKEIVYDVQFTERSEDLEEDNALASSIEQAGGVVLATSDADDDGETRVLGGNASLDSIGAEAGAANLVNDEDGVISRMPYAIGKLRTLSVVTAERVTGRTIDPDLFPAKGAWIDWRGGPGSFRTVSFVDVLEGRVDPALLRDAIVVVGSSEPTLQDVHATPTTKSRLMSGPEVQANAISTTLDGVPLRDAPGWLAGLVVTLMGSLAPLLRGQARTSVLVIGSLGLAGIYGFIAQGAFSAGMMLPVAWPLLALTIGLIGSIAVTNVVESSERVRVARDNELLERRVRERTAELQETQLEVVHRLALAAELRDDETGRHIARLGILCQRLALICGMPVAEAETLRHAAVLHDVGKIGIPDEVLHKPGPFDAEERTLMQTHTIVGAELLSDARSDLMRMAREIALTHHERWDGTGYPHRLAGEQIPLVGRICAICDVFDALLSERPYKHPWPLTDVLDEMRAQSGRHFDPNLMERFLKIAPGLYDELHGDGAPARVPAAR
jgi:CHASE2 domain-containing sensor protein